MTESVGSSGSLQEESMLDLDLCFAIDCTGSMGSYINKARESIRTIVDQITKMEKCTIRLSMIEYRDHPPQDSTFITRVHQLTESIDMMETWLSNCIANGGGDGPEAVADALQDALELDWKPNGVKVCILILDAPPHGLDSHCDSFPNGCPLGYDPMIITDEMAEHGITLYTLGCEPAIIPYREFFSGLSFKTGGKYFPLSEANDLAQAIINSVIENISLEKLIDEAKSIATNAKVEIGHELDETELIKVIQTKLKEKGVVTRQIANSEKASSQAISFAKMNKMAQAKHELSNQPRVTHTDKKVKVESKLETESISYDQAERLVQKLNKRKDPAKRTFKPRLKQRDFSFEINFFTFMDYVRANRLTVTFNRANLEKEKKLNAYDFVSSIIGEDLTFKNMHEAVIKLCYRFVNDSDEPLGDKFMTLLNELKSDDFKINNQPFSYSQRLVLESLSHPKLIESEPSDKAVELKPVETKEPESTPSSNEQDTLFCLIHSINNKIQSGQVLASLERSNFPKSMINETEFLNKFENIVRDSQDKLMQLYLEFFQQKISTILSKQIKPELNEESLISSLYGSAI